ncbi:hypothetical protein ACNKHN_18285 [Shigella flexneri]
MSRTRAAFSIIVVPSARVAARMIVSRAPDADFIHHDMCTFKRPSTEDSNVTLFQFDGRA